MTKKYTFIFALASIFSLGMLESNMYGSICGADEQRCQDPDEPCKCYCSRICKPRKKTADDSPVFVPDDPAGHYCYCKQWDLDNFEERCAHNRRGRRHHHHNQNHYEHDHTHYHYPSDDIENNRFDSGEES